MARLKNPYPGVTRVTDRHGKIRWRFRRKGFSCYIQGAYGSPEFRASYEAATNEARTPAPYSVAANGTLSWLIENYLRSPKHNNKSETTRRVLRRELDWLRTVAGDLPVTSFRVRHIEALMAKKDGPAAANKVRKNLSLLFNYALKQEVEGVAGNPARAADRMNESEDGFHTWTEDEMASFLDYHRRGTKGRLVFLLALNTGASRADLARLTWGNIKGGKISYRRGKTGVAGEYSILPELDEELAHCPREIMLLVHHSEGQAYKPETLGNWFKDQCCAAGLPHCTLHGIRKGQATRIVNSGGTPDEVMAYLAHKTNAEGATYTKKANRGRLADSGLSRLDNVQPFTKVGQTTHKSGGNT